MEVAAGPRRGAMIVDVVDGRMGSRARRGAQAATPVRRAEYMAVRRARRRRRNLLACLAVLLIGATAGGISAWRSVAGRSRHPAAAKRKDHTPEVPAWSLVATLTKPVTAYPGPTTASGATTVPPSWAGQFPSMPVIAAVPGWEEVRVVTRPAGPATAWIPSKSAVITRTPYHVVVDLSMTRLLLFRRSRLLMCVPAAVGSAGAPTPLGHYFVALLAESPATDDGPFIVVTSAVVDGITGWEQSGNAVITIAGSASATLIGTARAHTTTGNVQLSAADEELLRPVPLGSPVDVVTALMHPLTRPGERMCDSTTGLPVPGRPRGRVGSLARAG